jgi:hypothetical protein
MSTNRHQTFQAAIALLGMLLLVLPTTVVAQSTGRSQDLDTAQVVLQATNVTTDGRLTFAGRGFVSSESASVTVEDDLGGIQAQLEPVRADLDGQISTVSVSVPGGLGPGPHTLRIAGLTSGRFGRATFQLQWQPPTVRLDAYTGKPTRTFGFSASGFVPGEPVDVYLGSQATDPLTTLTADGRGQIVRRDMVVPLINPGDYSLAFVGRSSNSPVTVGFNVQGFHPWVVLENYYLTPHAGVGFDGEVFIPGESVDVYLNTRLSQPVAQVAVDADGRFGVQNAFVLPDLTGNNQLIFVGQQSQTEVTATFAAATTTQPSTRN